MGRYLDLAHEKSNGEYVGEVPFGSDLAPDGRTLIPNATEQEAIVLMHGLRAKGLSFRAIAAELDKTGIRPKVTNCDFQSHGQDGHSPAAACLHRARCRHAFERAEQRPGH